MESDVEEDSRYAVGDAMKPADPAIEAAGTALAKLDGRDTPYEGDLIQARAAVIAYLTATMQPTQELLKAGCIAMQDLPREESMAMQLADGIQKGRKKMWYRYRAMRSAELSSLKGKVG